MKNISIVINDVNKDELSDVLKRESYITSFIFTAIECHNRQCEIDPQFSDRDLVVGHVPKIKAEILLDDEYVEQLVGVLKEVGGLKGRCTIYVTGVESCIKI